MPFNGSGSFSPPGSSFPAVSNTLIEAVKFNAIINDIATNGLSNCITKDGQTTTTQRIPFAAGASMGSQTITAVGAGTATTHAANVGQIQSGAVTTLGTVAGTNTITAAGTPAVAAYASGQSFEFIPAATNTGATTINVDSLGAKNVYFNGAACAGGELVIGVPARIKYDGTQFNIIGPTLPATQTQLEAATSNSVFVSPGRQKYHPSAAKAWVEFNGTGTLAVNASYNVSSVSDNGAGDYTVNFTTAFTNGSYYGRAFSLGTNANQGRFMLTDSWTESAFRIKVSNLADDANVDSSEVSAVFYGDQ